MTLHFCQRARAPGPGQKASEGQRCGGTSASLSCLSLHRCPTTGSATGVDLGNLGTLCGPAEPFNGHPCGRCQNVSISLLGLVRFPLKNLRPSVSDAITWLQHPGCLSVKKLEDLNICTETLILSMKFWVPPGPDTQPRQN